jgi:AraC-like DNA-binding protein/quercetin dioxygenase-like cupin family protein
MRKRIASVSAKNRLLARLVPGIGGIHIGSLVVAIENFYYHVTKDETQTVSEHSHGWYEFSQPVRGEYEYIFADRKVAANEQTVLFIPSGVAHQWEARSAPIVIMSFLLHVRAVDEAGEALKRLLSDKLEKDGYCYQRTEQAYLLEDIVWEAINNEAGSSLVRDKVHSLLRLYVVDFFHSHLAGLFPAPDFGDVSETNRSENELLVDQIMDYVGRNLGRSLRLEELATHFHFSPRHLTRVFKGLTGQSIGAYVLMRRLQEACDRLINSNQPVKRIAYELGFKDSSYFCRFFRNEVGMTPIQYRTLEHGLNVLEGDAAKKSLETADG